MLDVRLLGGFEIKAGKKVVALRSRPAQSLLAYLILNAGTSCRREKLAGLLWPDSSEESARDYLRHALWQIRKELKAASSAMYLKADDLTVCFDAASDYWLDAAALRDVEEGGPVERLMEALSAYKGELLPGFYDEWVVLEREHLQAIYERKAARLLDLLHREQRWAEVLEWGERWISIGQKPEAAYRYMMTTYAVQGDMAKAAATYERYARTLAEFGMEPSGQTRQLLEEIRAGRYNQPIGQTTSEDGTIVGRPVARLPIPLTGFIGREKELAAILRGFSSARLLTLVGPGGVGKTRLAIEAGRKLEKKFRDGVYWVELVGLSDAALVPQAVLGAVGAPDMPNRSPLDTLTEYLQSRQSLLILDNCEHLITACAQLSAHLLASCTELRILDTSREALDILGETTWTVPSLSLPADDRRLEVQAVARFESVRLLLERIAAVNPEFELTEHNAAAVIQICNRLSGIPLAIELAAARARMMSVEEIAKRLEMSFDLLTAGNRAALPRHQTIRATIDWSHELLTPLEKVLFRRLGVFAGGFALEAAEEVASDETLSRSEVVETLGHLVVKSMVSTQSKAAPDTRYHMLETIRQYARERIEAAGEMDDLRDRHLEYFAAFADRTGINSRGIATVESWQRVAADVENLRLALSWPGAAQRDTECLDAALKNRYSIIGALGDFWESRFRNEILQVMDQLLATDVAGKPSRERASALSTAGFIQWSLHNFEAAGRYLDESLAIAESIGDQLTAAWALSHLGWNADFVGNYEEAQVLGMKSVAIGELLGDQGRYVVGQSLSFLGDIPYSRGDLVEARRLYEEAVSFLREIHEVNRLTYPLRRLGYVSLAEGSVIDAVAHFAESLDLNRQIGHLQGIIACVAGLAAAHMVAGRAERAAGLYGWVQFQLRRNGAPFFFIDTLEYQQGLSRLVEALDPARLDVSKSKGAGMTLEEAVHLALQA